MSQVWVNGRILETYSKKIEKWKPEEAKEKTVWGSCPDCGKDIMSGETVWWMSHKKVCYDCREPYMRQGIGHLDCSDLEFPDSTLSQ